MPLGGSLRIVGHAMLLRDKAFVGNSILYTLCRRMCNPLVFQRPKVHSSVINVLPSAKTLSPTFYDEKLPTSQSSPRPEKDAPYSDASNRHTSPLIGLAAFQSRQRPVSFSSEMKKASKISPCPPQAFVQSGGCGGPACSIV